MLPRSRNHGHSCEVCSLQMDCVFGLLGRSYSPGKFRLGRMRIGHEAQRFKVTFPGEASGSLPMCIEENEFALSCC
jgi:hypothetical protein